MKTYQEPKIDAKDSFLDHMTSESYDSGNVSSECSKLTKTSILFVSYRNKDCLFK